MKFYTKQHKHYCGIDLHARNFYVCILNQDGNILIHKNIKANPQALMTLITPYRDDLVIGVECMFSWYWVADLCRQKGIAFILGHALYMRAIHGGKDTKSSGMILNSFSWPEGQAPGMGR